MKILMCNKFNFRHGGAEAYLLDLSRGLREQGHEVIEFSSKHERNLPSPYTPYFVAGADFSDGAGGGLLSKARSGLNLIYSLEAAKKIEVLIDRYRPDIAHIHNIYHHMSSSILWALRRKKIPVVMTVHDYKLICPNYTLFRNGAPCEECRGHRYYNALRYRCVKDSYCKSAIACLEMYFCKLLKPYEKTVELFIAPSRCVESALVRFGMDPRRIRYLPHAVDLEGFTPDHNRGAYILYFGNITEKKGIMDLLKAAKELPSALRLKIVGEGPFQEQVDGFIRRAGLTNVECAGYTAKQELPALIRGALFAVIPSGWAEPAGLSVYEAFACGKCVIGARSGGIPELIDDGADGLLFDPGDFGELAAKIRYLAANPGKAEEFGRNGCAKIKKLNDRSGHYRELLRIYRERIDNRSS
jgi:glycosyltransferase involved in cell wall biosynthesis